MHHDGISMLHAACVNVNQSLRPILFASGRILAFPHATIAHRLRIRDIRTRNVWCDLREGSHASDSPLAGYLTSIEQQHHSTKTESRITIAISGLRESKHFTE